LRHLVDLVLQFLVEWLEFLKQSLDVDKTVNYWMLLDIFALHLEQQEETEETAIRYH